jgi:hypothetical protein
MQAPARAATTERRGIGHRRRRRALVTTGLNVRQHGLGGGGPPCRLTTTATAPSTPELHAPPSCPEAAARTGPHRPRSGPTAMRGHGRLHALQPPTRALRTVATRPPCASTRRRAIESHRRRAIENRRRRPGRRPSRRAATGEGPRPRRLWRGLCPATSSDGGGEERERG